LKLKTSTPNYLIYGELRLFPIEIDFILDKIVKAGKESKRSYLSYKTLYNIFRDENAINVDNCVLYLQNIPE
jgi:hypothetical protein